MKHRIVLASWVGRERSLPIVVGALLLGCGSAADGAPLAPAEALPDPEALPESEAMPDSATPAVGGAAGEGDAPPPECVGAFAACGGVLAGEWSVAGTCDVEARGDAALARWGSGFMPIDISACSDAVETLVTRWSGRLLFQNGVLVDERLRSDTLELSLTSECLGVALGQPVGEAALSSVCSGLSGGDTLCTLADGLCRCSAQREELANTSGSYGVLGTRVAVASPDSSVDRIDYCVRDAELHWQDADTGQHLLLRRSAQAPLDR